MGAEGLLGEQRGVRGDGGREGRGRGRLVAVEIWRQGGERLGPVLRSGFPWPAPGRGMVVVVGILFPVLTRRGLCWWWHCLQVRREAAGLGRAGSSRSCRKPL